MIYSTATVPVNPEGATPLTRAQVWKGLVLKARDARLFLPPNLCTRCEVVEESATHIVRRQHHDAARRRQEGHREHRQGDVAYQTAAGVRKMSATQGSASKPSLSSDLELSMLICLAGIVISLALARHGLDLTHMI